MGSKATDTRVAADMQPPNYRAAVQRLRTIKTKKEKIAGINGDIADVYAKVEGHKVNKKAARIFLILDALDGPDRMDVMRSFNGLCDAAGWAEEGADLIDQAEGTVVPFRAKGGDAEQARDDVDAALDQLEAESEADAANQFLKSARAHLGAGAASDAAGAGTDETGAEEDGD